MKSTPFKSWSEQQDSFPQPHIYQQQIAPLFSPLTSLLTCGTFGCYGYILGSGAAARSPSATNGRFCILLQLYVRHFFVIVDQRCCRGRQAAVRFSPLTWQLLSSLAFSRCLNHSDIMISIIIFNISIVISPQSPSTSGSKPPLSSNWHHLGAVHILRNTFWGSR